MKLQFERQKGS